MAKLEKIEFISLPDVRIIGCKVSHSLAPGAENPVPTLWSTLLQNGTMHILKSLPLAVPDCTIGWMGNVSGQNFQYIAGVIAKKGTPVPEGMQYRDLPACCVAQAHIFGNLQNGDVYSSAYDLTVKGIVENGYQPDDRFGWSAEVYPDTLSFEAENGILCYYQPYKN